ncbi:hypothetical protein Ddye_020160 [Dipteronia dyeriana]|uniref:Uncharacterized protein n=1 Tax=Dipteronia dyeriana TaxID=168575 RepID=A0AAD9U0A0_9ROSI|nr:hypothetical protein Ddye_020160 [Dipteronia dyeriana]
MATSTRIQAVTPDLTTLDVKDIYPSAHHELGTAQILPQVKGSKIVKRCKGWKEKWSSALLLKVSFMGVNCDHVRCNYCNRTDFYDICF